jgi:subtilisin family serine protease
MATGVASGAVADLLQADPNLTPDQVKALLMQNANRWYNRTRMHSTLNYVSPMQYEQDWTDTLIKFAA